MKKRKFTLAILMILATTSTMNAQSAKPNVNGEQILLTCSYDPPIKTGSEYPKAPKLMPSVYIDSYTLYVDGRLADYTLELLQGGEVIYQHYILYGESNIDLPSTLSGEYVIRFVNDEGNAYLGVITL